ncbi:MAG TPA: response regulator [Kofleriaceae bacterium]
MKISLRLKLFILVAISVASLVGVKMASNSYEQRVADQLASIRNTYLPKIRLRPQLQAELGELIRTIQGAVEASDSDLLAGATAKRDHLIERVVASKDALSADQIAGLQFAINDYYSSAIDVSHKLINGAGDEAALAQVQTMQGKRDLAVSMVDRATVFDDSKLDAAFATAREMQDDASTVRTAVTAACVVVLLALSLWIGIGLGRHMHDLVSGLQRFGRNDFAQPINIDSGDELAMVAAQANAMASELRELDDARSRRTWVDAGIAALYDELRDELTPAEAASRAVATLARYIDAPLGAVYHGPPGGPYRLLARYGASDGGLPGLFAHGEGLVGQAATLPALTLVTSDEADLTLRSGLLETKARAIALLPLVRGGQVTGVLELATVRAWSEKDSELLARASNPLATSLEVARARAATATLLEQTRLQAAEIERARANLEQKASELARASAYKSQFLASMSHELRTPLNAIIGFSELMFDGEIELEPEQQREYLGDILTSGRHLLQLINDVLDLSKVEAGKLEFRPEATKLTSLVNEVLGVLKSVGAKHHVTVATEIASEIDEVTLDPARLKQVLYNYLSNAIKFSPMRSTVTVRALAEGENVRIEIEDRGPGIKPDDLPRLFADFQQLADGARKSGGTGLGLALTKRLVEAQGGSVGVRSTVGQGSVFFAVLPRRATGAVVAPPTVLVAPRPGAPTVLVVEDEPIDRQRLVEVLLGAGYSVEAVGTGAEALARCKERTYDAITLDLFLPDMPGLEVLDAVRKGRNDKCPVIVVTVVAEPGAVAGFAIHDVLAKPLDDSALLSSLQRANVMPHGEHSIVLVIDDDPAALRVMAATLAQLGYLAVCETDPVRGLRAATEEPPGAIVLDLVMPNMTGFEFLAAYRTQPSERQAPVIVWTSKDLDSNEMAILRRSAHAVVSKGKTSAARVVEELAVVLPIRHSEVG